MSAASYKARPAAAGVGLDAAIDRMCKSMGLTPLEPTAVSADPAARLDAAIDRRIARAAPPVSVAHNPAPPVGSDAGGGLAAAVDRLVRSGYRPS
ncbi:hypothetical protein [Rhodoplanes sp. SY1]|uniref:hypothetical protein n=1 Tax=Rhodoplanes sp. SY1 TaxID=3166646 RepID=UPI0038B683E0